MAFFVGARSNSTIESSPPSTSRKVTFGVDNNIVHEYFSSSKQSTQLNDDEQTLNEKICVCVCYAGGMLGAAVFMCNDGEMHLLQDVADNINDLTLIYSLIKQVCPTHVIACQRQDKRFLECLSQICFVNEETEKMMVHVKNNEREFDDEGDEDEELDDFDVEFDDIDGVDNALQYVNTNNNNNVLDVDCKPELVLMKNAVFYAEHARRRVQMMFSGGEGNEHQRHIQLAFSLNIDCPSMLRAAGALLYYLEEHNIAVSINEYHARVQVNAVKEFTIERMLEVDSNTKAALHIFHAQLHPSVFKAGKESSAKEGCSVFGINNRCTSSVGRAELRRWWAQPRWGLEQLELRQHAVKFLALDSNLELMRTLRKEIVNVKGPGHILNRMKKGASKPADWKCLAKSLNCMTHVARTLSPVSHGAEYLHQLCSEMSVDLSAVVQMIVVCVDFEESRKENRFVMQPGVDKELDKMKRQYNDINPVLNDLADEESRRFKYYSTSCGVEYLPMLGFFMTVIPEDDTTEEDWLIAIPDAYFHFHVSNKNYYKTGATERMDNILGDIKMKIIDQETTMMLDLETAVLNYISAIINATRAAAKIDALMSIAMSNRENEGVAMNLARSDDSPSVICIKDGRHPLVEKSCLGNYVSNDFVSGGIHGKVGIITGPNASGKSVYLKQVGINVYECHVAGHVCARKGSVTPVDKMFSRLHSLDTLVDGLSTFARDLQQMSMALRRATGDSVVIIDEFGKGTVTLVGLSLLCASIQYWMSRGESACPHILISTHMHTLTSLLPETHLLRVQTLNVVQRGTELVYLHELVTGSIEMSFAIETAQRLGIDSRVCSRAQMIMDCRKDKQPIPVNNKSHHMQKSRTAADHFETWDENEARQFLCFYNQLLTVSSPNENSSDKSDSPSPAPQAPFTKQRGNEDIPRSILKLVSNN